MRLAAARLAMAGMSSSNLIQKRVALMLLQGLQNSIIVSNSPLGDAVDSICDAIRSTRTENTEDALTHLEESSGGRYPGLPDLVESAKWHLSHGFIYLLFVRGLFLVFLITLAAMAGDPFALDRLWNTIVDSIAHPEPLLSARYGLWIVIWVVLIMIIHRILNFLHSQWIDNQFMTVLSVTLDMELDEKLDLNPDYESAWVPTPPPGRSLLFKHRLRTTNFRLITVTGSNDANGTICSYQVGGGARPGYGWFITSAGHNRVQLTCALYGGPLCYPVARGTPTILQSIDRSRLVTAGSSSSATSSSGPLPITSSSHLITPDGNEVELAGHRRRRRGARGAAAATAAAASKRRNEGTDGLSGDVDSKGEKGAGQGVTEASMGVQIGQGLAELLQGGGRGGGVGVGDDAVDRGPGGQAASSDRGIEMKDMNQGRGGSVLDRNDAMERAVPWAGVAAGGAPESIETKAMPPLSQTSSFTNTAGGTGKAPAKRGLRDSITSFFSTSSSSAAPSASASLTTPSSFSNQSSRNYRKGGGGRGGNAAVAAVEQETLVNRSDSSDSDFDDGFEPATAGVGGMRGLDGASSAALDSIRGGAGDAAGSWDGSQSETSGDEETSIVHGNDASGSRDRDHHPAGRSRRGGSGKGGGARSLRQPTGSEIASTNFLADSLAASAPVASQSAIMISLQPAKYVKIKLWL